MKEKLKHYSKEILSFIIVMFIISNLISYYRSTELNNTPLDIKYEFINDKPILIHFWAEWCPTCNIEAANIQTISENYQVLTFAVKSGSDEDIKNYMLDNNLDFEVINDNDGFFAQKFNIKVYPTTFIYDKDKNLVFSEVGYTSTIGLYFRMWWAGVH